MMPQKTQEAKGTREASPTIFASIRKQLPSKALQKANTGLVGQFLPVHISLSYISHALIRLG